MKICNFRLLGKNKYPIWYRGQQSIEYKLVPSLMRKYKEQKAKQKNKKEFSLAGFLREEFEQFRYKTDNLQEAAERGRYTTGDYLALMQHYSTPSNFLDWTENALSALYFALEGFLDEKVNKTNKDAALYIFSPALYNYARKKMILWANGKEKANVGLEEEIVKTAQDGIFLAYNIFTKPGKEDDFDYVALEKVQEYYLKEFREDEETCPFLYKVAIKKEERGRIASWVEAFGMNKEKCYPELSNIGEKIMK